MKSRFLVVARDEVTQAAAYDRAVSPELGDAFRRCLRDTLQRVSALPSAWPSCGEGIRRCLLARFPYLVIDAPLPDGILVLAVGHQHRHPDFWRDRLPPPPR